MNPVIPRQAYIDGHRNTERRLSIWITLARKELDTAAALGNEEATYAAASLLDALCKARNEVRIRLSNIPHLGQA